MGSLSLLVLIGGISASILKLSPKKKNQAIYYKIGLLLLLFLISILSVIFTNDYAVFFGSAGYGILMGILLLPMWYTYKKFIDTYPRKASITALYILSSLPALALIFVWAIFFLAFNATADNIFIACLPLTSIFTMLLVLTPFNILRDMKKNRV